MTFIHQIASQLIGTNWNNLHHYVLVFPMDRAKAYFTEQFRQLMLEQQHTTPVVLPQMLTLDGMVSELSELHLADEIRAVCTLYEIYNKYLPANESDRKALSLDAFYGWGRQLFNDFNSIDMALCNTQRVIANLADAQKLDELNLDEETQAALQQLIHFDYPNEKINQFFHQLWQQLPAIYKDFTQQLQQEHAGTKGACYKNVIDHFNQWQSRFEGKTIVFVGFNYLLPAEREIMRLFHHNHQAMFFWDDDPHFTTDPTVYQFIRENIDEFGQNLTSPELLSTFNFPLSTKVTALCTQSCNAQVQYVHQWLSDHFDPAKRTAVVITDESILESVLYALPDSLSEQVNITKGFPLKSTAVFTEVIRYLSDPNNDRHPGETFADVLQRLGESLSEPPYIADPQTATWQQLLQQEAYGQTLLAINRFIALCQDDVLKDVTELRTLRNLLRRALETISLPFHGESTAPVQIIGVLETRLLDFDQVLVLNVEEGIVPGKSADRSFIPFDLRKAYRMQTHDEEAKIYAYNFFRLIRRSGNVTLMYSEAAGDMTKKSMSRFLMQMLLSTEFKVTKYNLTEPADSNNETTVDTSKSWMDKCSLTKKKLPDGKTIPHPVLSLSPSALNTYIECPRQFYLSNIVGIRESDTPSLIFAPNDMGTFFHASIEYAYKTISGGKIDPQHVISCQDIEQFIGTGADDPQWLRNSNEALQAGFQKLIDDYNDNHSEHNGETVYVPSQHKAETEVVRTMLRGVLEYDAKNCNNLRIISLECDYRRLIHVDNVDVLTGGVIDRLDVIEENGQQYLRILDYKTGTHSIDKVSAKNIQDLFVNTSAHYVLQTLIYSSVCNEYPQVVNPNGLPIMPQLLFTQKLSADKHLLIQEQPIMDFKKECIGFDDELISKISEILSEPNQDHPWHQTDEKTCEKSFCLFHLLCGREKKEW